MGKIGADIAVRSWLFKFWHCSRLDHLGRYVKHFQISNRTKIQTANFQLQYLPHFYPLHLKIVFEPFTKPCEWVAADLGVIWVESEQKVHFKVSG